MALIRNSAMSMLATAIPLVITVVTLPIFIRTIGAERYGAIALCWLILIYVGKADFGVARAATQRIAANRKAGTEAQAQIAATAVVMSFVMSALLGLGSFGAAHWYFAGPLDISETVRAELLSGAWIIGVSTFVVSFFAVVYGCLVGREEFGATSMSTLIGNSASQILPLLVAVFFSIDLYWLLAATLVARLLGALPGCRVFWRDFMRHQASRPSRFEMSQLLTYGKWVMVLSIVRPIMAMADRLLIGVQLGALAVTAYTVPFQIATRLQLIPLSVLLVLFPRLAALEPEEARRQAITFLVVFANIFAPLIVGGICLAEPLLRLWLGSALDEQSILLARIILAGVWVSGIAGVANNYTMARGDSRYAAMLRLYEFPFYLGGLYLAAEWFGLPGVAVAFVLLQVADLFFLAGRERLIGTEILLRTLASVITITIPIFLHPYLSGWTASIGAAALLCPLAAANAWIFAPPAHRARLLAALPLRRRAG